MGQKNRGVQAAVMAAVTSLLGLHGALLQHLEPSSKRLVRTSLPTSFARLPRTMNIQKPCTSAREQQRDTMRTQSRGSVFKTWFSLIPTWTKTEANNGRKSWQTALGNSCGSSLVSAMQEAVKFRFFPCLSPKQCSYSVFHRFLRLSETGRGHPLFLYQ